MPKGNRGGQRASGTNQQASYTIASGSMVAARRRLRQKQAAQQANPQPAPQPTPQPTPAPAPTPSPAQVAQGNIMPAGGVPFKTFETMTDSQKAKVITDSLKSGVPMFLDNSDLQRFAYFTGMNDKPQLVTESALNAMPGKDLWRSIHQGYKSNADVGYSNQDIYNQVVKGDYTNYSDSGGSAYGKAIYFDVHKGSYGSGGRHLIMHAKLVKGAKTITDAKLSAMYNGALLRNDPVALACAKADRGSRENLFALAKGYDAKIDSGGYHMIFNRRCLAISDKTF